MPCLSHPQQEVHPEVYSVDHSIRQLQLRPRQPPREQAGSHDVQTLTRDYTAVAHYKEPLPPRSAAQKAIHPVDDDVSVDLGVVDA